MDGVVAYILGKSYVKKSLIGIGALAGAPCQVQSINKVGKTTTITLKWEDNVGGVHTQAFDVEDGADGVSVVGATIDANGHLILTLSDTNIIDCGKVLPQYDTMPIPSVSNVGQILQYVGTTNINYTKGYFYECVESPVGSGTYIWKYINVQDSYTKIEIGDLTNLPDNTKDVVENIVDIQLEINQLQGSLLDKEDRFRYNVIPSANASIDGVIIEYIGATNANYTNGYFYQCVESPVGSGTYIWVQKNVQPSSGSGGGDDVIDGYYNTSDYKFYEEPTYVNEIIGKTGKIYISDDTNIQYRWDGTQFVVISSSIAVDDALSATSLNPVQNKVIALKIDELEGSILDRIKKKLAANADDFAIFTNDGDIADSGISKDIVPSTASVSNKLLVATDLIGGSGIDITGKTISVDIPYLTASRVGYIPATEKGANDGVAELDSYGKVPSSQLPSYIDDVLDGYLYDDTHFYKEEGKGGYYNTSDNQFYEDSGFTTLITPVVNDYYLDIPTGDIYQWNGTAYVTPTTAPTRIIGEGGVIYISVDSNIQYRWTGTAFSALGGALQLGETSTTAYRGDRGKTAYDHSQITDGSNPHNTTADNVNLKVPISALSGSKLDVESTLYGLYNKSYLTDDTTETAIDDADYVPFYDSSVPAKRKSTWENIKSILKTYFDTIYATINNLKNYVSWKSADKFVGKNLLENHAVSTTTPIYGTLMYTVDSNGVITGNGTSNSNDSTFWIWGDGWGTSHTIPIEKTRLEIGETYTLYSGNNSTNAGVIFYFYNGDTFISSASTWTGTGKIDMTVPANTTHICAILRVRNGATINNDKFYPMITYQDVPITLPNDYESYIYDNTQVMSYVDNGILGAKNRLPLTLENLKNWNTGGTWSGNVFTHTNGVTYTVTTDNAGNVKNISVNGSPSVVTTFTVGELTGLSGNWILNGIIGGSQSTYGIQLYDKTSATWTSQYSVDRDAIVNLEDSTHNYRFAFFVRNDVTVSNISIKPMLRLITDTDSTYQPYAMTNAELTKCVTWKDV